MKPAAFDYVRPADTGAAVAALAAAGEARLLAGGQTLGPMLNLRLARPSLLVDIARIEALRRIERRASTLVIGACVTHAALEDRADPSPTGRLLAHVASGIAYRAIRNFGTIGGSLAHADPAADWITAMMLLDARLRIAGASGERSVPMGEFMKGAFTTDIGPAELLVGIDVEELSPQACWGYYRVCRKVGEFPDAVGAVILDPERSMARVVVGALDGAPVQLPALAESVAAQGAGVASLEAVSAAVAQAAPGLDPVELQLHAVAVRRAILQAVGS